jgi:ADP-ribosylglycohydrolase
MNKDKIIGAWMGAAIGDAMGGPVECQHYKNIVNKVGYVDQLLSYSSEWSIIDLQPGYALHEEAGSITDDTYIRADIADFLLDTKPPYTAQKLCDYLLNYADFSYWWKPAVDALDRVKNGTDIKKSGESHLQGGGNGWWYPIAIICEGNAQKACNLVRQLSQPWKSAAELDLLGALIGAMAYCLREDATYEGVIQTALNLCEGSFAKDLIKRAVEVGELSTTWSELCENVYKRILIQEEPPRDKNASLPPEIQGVEFTNEKYTSVYFAEQVPLMFAGFVFGKGKVESINATVMLGRDCDSTATAVGFLVGGLNGHNNLPEKWVSAVQQSNLNELDLLKMGNRLYDLASQKDLTIC